MSRHLLLTLLAPAALCCTLCGELAAGETLLRDEALILQLLRHGEVNLNPPAALELPQSQSELRIRRIGLSGNGVSIRAAFRDKSRRVAASREISTSYRDAYYNEVAAYVIALELGLNMVPVTVLREIHIAATGLRGSRHARQGSLQHWVENAIVQYDLDKGEREYPGDRRLKNLQLSEILVFDCIIGNVDRHAGNVLIDLNPRYPIEPGQTMTEPLLGKLWAIDHSRSFHRGTRINDAACKIERVAGRPVSLGFMRALRQWRPQQAAAGLRSAGLSVQQLESLHLDSLDQRLAKVRAHLEQLQAESGLADDEFYSAGIWHRVR